MSTSNRTLDDIREVASNEAAVDGTAARHWVSVIGDPPIDDVALVTE